MNCNGNTLSERIKIIRGNNTYDRFAEILSGYGHHFSKGNLSKYEHGIVKPSTDFYSAISKMGYNINWLITGEGKMKNNEETSDWSVKRLKSKTITLRYLGKLWSYYALRESEIRIYGNGGEGKEKELIFKNIKDCLNELIIFIKEIGN